MLRNPGRKSGCPTSDPVLAVLSFATLIAESSKTVQAIWRMRR
jgi:hypothetical protein